MALREEVLSLAWLDGSVPELEREIIIYESQPFSLASMDPGSLGVAALALVP